MCFYQINSYVFYFYCLGFLFDFVLQTRKTDDFVRLQRLVRQYQPHAVVLNAQSLGSMHFKNELEQAVKLGVSVCLCCGLLYIFYLCFE